MPLRGLFARPCTSTLRVFREHPAHLFAQRVARATSPERRGPESPAEPTESIESSTIAFFDAFETETDGQGVSTCRSAHNETMLSYRRCRPLRGVVRHGQKPRGVVWMGRVRWRWLERVCVDEGCEWDGCHGEKAASVGACLGLVGHWETRSGKGEKLVAEHVSDGSDGAHG